VVSRVLGIHFAVRWPARDPEGGALFRRLGGEQYESELEAEMALKALTVDSWISM
jgi:hypothetical protein